MQTRTDLVNGRGDRYGRAGARRKIGERWALRIINHELFLRNAVQTIGLQNLSLLKAIVKNAEASAENNLGRSTFASDAPGKTQTRRPVRMVLNTGLTFEAQAVTQSNVRTHFPIVLIIETSIEISHHQRRLAQRVGELGCDRRGSVSCILKRGCIGDWTGRLPRGGYASLLLRCWQQ